MKSKLSRCVAGWISFVVGSALTAAAAAQSPPSYTAEFLGAATGATAMNQSGTMVGTIPLAPVNERSWVASHGSPLTPLPLSPGRISSRAYDINDAGVIAGTVCSATYADPNFGAVAALWIPNGSGGYTVQELGTLPGEVGSAATALNNVGDVVGFSFDGMFRRAVWFTAPGGILDLNSYGAFDPSGVNDQRVVVCVCTIPFTNHCGRFDLNTLTVQDLGVPPGNFRTTTGVAINATNQVAGLAILTTGTSCDREAARYTDGVGWEVFSGCGPSNGCGSLNDGGDVTMWINVASYVRYEGIGTYRIEDLIVSPVGHWSLFIGTGQINNSRQIAVAGTNSATGQSGLLLLTPDAPGTSTCFGDGTAGACPCGNSGNPGHGCQNSAGTGGSILRASGVASLSADTLLFTASGERPTALSVFLQGDTAIAPVNYGDGLRCTGGGLKRLYAKNAIGGTVAAPQAGDASVSARSTALGDPISTGATRLYQVYYRDPNTSFCPSPSGGTFNVSNAIAIVWGS